PSTICSGIPPTSPPIVGRPFQSDSATVSPKPSRIDFCMTTSDWDWNAFTSIAPTLLRLLRILMSGSDPAYSKVRWKNSQPSGSSGAIGPPSANGTSGTSLVTSRYASITPIGSFQGSNRETWVIIGRSTSIPNWLQTKAASSGESAMFFGERGSIAGGTIRTPPWPSSPFGTYCSRCQTVISYSAISGSSRLIGSGFGSERSMWQRQTQCFDRSGASWRIATGCGSWTMITSHSPSSESAFILL